MREFFQGWRRKIGCATLVMACVLMIGWVRSMREFHCLAVAKNMIVQSTKGRVTLFWDNSDSRNPVLWWHGETTDESYDPLQAQEGLNIDWRWSCAGVTLGAYTVQEGSRLARTDVYDVRYWLLVIPLTLLSAYLILWKPRKRKMADQPTISNLISN
jgi:hypothetical protein